MYIRWLANIYNFKKPEVQEIIELEFPHNIHISTFYPQCLQRFTIEIPCSGFRGVPLTNCSILYSIYDQILVQKCQKSLKNNKIIILWEYAHLHCVLNTFTMFFSMEIPVLEKLCLQKKLGLTDGRVKKHHTPRNLVAWGSNHPYLNIPRIVSIIIP